ncbi:MAG TPA: NAD-dependent epimerase/dehydratase family protein, partial [Gemmatimonadaceae bacterium]
MRLLVSGAAGFLGSHFCDRLVADGHSVLGVDNLLSGDERNLESLRNEPRFEFRRADVSEPAQYGKVDGVLHLASLASPVDYLLHPIDTLKAG